MANKCIWIYYEYEKTGEDSFAILGEPVASRLSSIDFMLRELADLLTKYQPTVIGEFEYQVPNLSGLFDLSIARELAGKILKMLPREDVDGHGVDVDRIGNDRLFQLLLGENSEIMQLMQPDSPVEPEIYEGETGGSIELPEPKSGHFLADLLARLTLKFGDFHAANLIVENYGLGFITSFSWMLVEAARSPQERFNELAKDTYAKIKENERRSLLGEM